MSHRESEAALEALVRGGARLLRVQSAGPHALSLHFDRAALEIAAAGRALELWVVAEAPPDAEAELLDEVDPWWTVIGEPLSGAWSATDTEGRRVALELQLRSSDRNPKRIRIEPRADGLDARGVSATP